MASAEDHDRRDEHDDREVEYLLRAAAPQPDREWVRATEARLLPARRRSRWAPALVAAGALGAAVFVISLSGGGPLAHDGGDAAKARPGCTYTYVTRVEPQGELRKRADGTVQVETVQRPVTRRVEHCR